MENMKIGIASDHAGFHMNEYLIGWRVSKGYDVHDFGCSSDQPCDYPDYAHPLGYAIEDGELPRGITLCGSGNGISMAINKHQGIRAALCWTPEIAHLARQHNDANVCSIPARFVDNDIATQILEEFLNTAFEGGRHQARIDKIPIPCK